MKAVIASALLVCAAIPAAEAQPRPDLVPRGWTQVYQDRATKTRRFESPDRSVVLVTRQVPAARGDIGGDMDSIAYHDGEQITYQRRGRTWIAVSGYRGDDIFYRKSNLACGGSRWNQVEFYYPRADKKRLDATVTAVARDMTRYASDC